MHKKRVSFLHAHECPPLPVPRGHPGVHHSPSLEDTPGDTPAPRHIVDKSTIYDIVTLACLSRYIRLRGIDHHWKKIKKTVMEENYKNIGKNIGILCRQLNLFLNHELDDYDITASEIMYLGSLFIKDGVSQEELVREFSMDKAAVARTIHSLEDKKLITRSCSEDDKRSKRIYLTDNALMYRDVLTSIQDKWYRAVLIDSDPDEMAVFAEVLNKISNRMHSLDNK